jgi:gluconate 2-dehydrogenase gamma chain
LCEDDRQIRQYSSRYGADRIGRHFFTKAEAATVAAIVDQIYPPNALGPGAVEAGVPTFIDQELSGPWGRGERMYRDPPFREPTHGGHGWQSPLTPAEVYRTGLSALDRFTTRDFGEPFVALTAADQHDVLTAVEAGLVDTFSELDPVSFFALIRQNVIEGLFADPRYGGNRDMAGWRWLGFPGDPDAHDYRGEIDRLETPYAGEPAALPVAPGSMGQPAATPGDRTSPAKSERR